MATIARDERAIAPFDVSDERILVEDSWREKFAHLLAGIPVKVEVA